MQKCSLFFLSFLTASALACEGFLPTNPLFIPTTLKNLQGLTQTEFDGAIDRAFAHYTPVIEGSGFKLRVEKKWESGIVNAKTSIQGSITFHGGLGRMNEMTEDAMTLVACHEIGHLIGGNPRFMNHSGLNASSEGQSDYFGALKCLKKVFQKEDSAKYLQGKTVPKIVVDECLNSDDPQICQRISLAGFDLASVLNSLNDSPISFETPDQTVVLRTVTSYTSAQCRLDTFFQAAICEVPVDEKIPLLGDEAAGVCHLSLGFTKGSRPACWYKTDT